MLRSAAQVVAFLRDEIPQERVEEWWPHATFPATSKHLIECRGNGLDQRFVWCIYTQQTGGLFNITDLIEEIETDVIGLEELELYTSIDAKLPSFLASPEVQIEIKPLRLSAKRLAWGDSSLFDAARLVHKEWLPFFEKHAPMLEAIDSAIQGDAVLPPLDRVFSLFTMLPPSRVRVIVIGQDPYHGVGQANGIAFSVKAGVKPPPSLVNIFKEIERSTSIKNTNGDLTSWVEQGVFLINTALTVKESDPGSHLKHWEPFTNDLMRFLNERCPKAIVLSWGNKAHKQSAKLTNCTVLRSAHPSPLSVKNFMGCCHFTEVNHMLRERGEKRIDWST